MSVSWKRTVNVNGIVSFFTMSTCCHWTIAICTRARPNRDICRPPLINSNSSECYLLIKFAEKGIYLYNLLGWKWDVINFTTENISFWKEYYNFVFNFRLPYSTIFGGVSALTTDQFQKVNGFSNSFWGWGGEDDDMANRYVIIFVLILNWIQMVWTLFNNRVYLSE